MKPDDDKLTKMLNEHSAWVLSLGKTGRLADCDSWNLDTANLEMANLPFAKFHFASLKNANLSGVNFRQAELLKIKLINANLDGADFEGANLSKGDLSFSKCTGANFTDANLESANFSGANLQKANFTRAILRGANFKGADLSFAEMVDTNIEGADFKRAKTEAANFGGANLDKANFEETNFKVYNLDEYLPENESKDTRISDRPRSEKTPPESVKKNHKLDKTTLDRSSNIKSTKEDLFVDSNSKAINPDMIDEAVIGMVEKLKPNIQLDLVKSICKHKHGIEKIDKIDFENGDLVTHNDRVAFKLDFKISHKVSLFIDRKGNLLT
ncbi:MAG: pentapeptide repeat-containing protein [Desulfobacterales bacterium]|jgi:hypothetical protein